LGQHETLNSIDEHSAADQQDRATAALREPAASRLLRASAAVPVLLAACVFIVHDVGYMLRQTFWIDEAWVAVTTKYPLGRLPDVTSSTPIGWSLLLRLFPGGGQDSRLLPLLFAAAAVAAGYAFGRGLGWADDWLAVGAGVLTGVSVLMAPAMLVRNDLKQYTADVCMALLVLIAVSRLERQWTRTQLGVLAGTVAGGMLLSHTTAFVGVAAFAGVGLVQVARREWRRVLECVVAGGVALVAMGVIYELADARAVVPGLTSYWRAYYVPIGRGLSASWHYLSIHADGVAPYVGLGPIWIWLLLDLAGLATLVWVGRPMTAATLVLLVPEVIAISGARKYPLFSVRASAFLLVLGTVLAAVAVAGLCAVLRRRSAVAAIALAGLAAALFVAGNAHYARQHTIPNQDVRAQADFVATHRQPNDVILVNLGSNWGFGYYWRQDRLSRRRDSNVLQSYEVVFPDQPRIVVAAQRDGPGVRAALTTAVNRARGLGAGRIWLIRTDVNRDEVSAWRAAFQAERLQATPIGPRGLTAIAVN
jgi:hypothetical protein